MFIAFTVQRTEVEAYPSPQGFFNTNHFIAGQQNGYGTSYGGRAAGPSVDPSAYYTGANRAKIARMLANYY